MAKDIKTGDILTTSDVAEAFLQAKAEPSTYDAIRTLAEAIAKNAQPSALDMAGISKEKQDALMGKAAKPVRHRYVPGKSEETDATFTMVVVESRRFPNGRIVRLENYREPEGCFKPMSQGGRAPDGATIWANAQHYQPVKGERPPKNVIHPYYRQYLYETYWKADLGRLVGKSFRERECLTPEGFKTPWEEGAMFAVDEDAA